MKANELRVGNLIRSKLLGTVHAVTGLLPSGSIYTDLQESYSDSDDWEAIPLTPEWLERLGFDKEGDDESTLIFYVNGPIVLWNRVAEKNVFTNRGLGNCPVKSIHQLQNLFYSLSGEELTVLC